MVFSSCFPKTAVMLSICHPERSEGRCLLLGTSLGERPNELACGPAALADAVNAQTKYAMLLTEHVAELHPIRRSGLIECALDGERRRQRNDVDVAERV